MKICAEIVKYLEGGNYLIRIEGDYNYYELHHNEIYCVNSVMLRKCDIELWENIKNYTNSNNNISDATKIREDINSSDISSEDYSDEYVYSGIRKKDDDHNNNDFIFKRIIRANSY